MMTHNETADALASAATRDEVRAVLQAHDVLATGDGFAVIEAAAQRLTDNEEIAQLAGSQIELAIVLLLDCSTHDEIPDLAIAHLNHGRHLITPQVSPERISMAHHGLGMAYRARSRGSRADNLEFSIQHYYQALKYRSEEDNPLDWAKTHANVGNVLRERIEGDGQENNEAALAHYLVAADANIRDMDLYYWALIQLNCADQYTIRASGDPETNIECAIFYYEQALEVITQTTQPQRWASANHNLASAYKNRTVGDAASNLEREIAHSEHALTILTPETAVNEWLKIIVDLTTAYSNRIHGVRADNLDRAIEYFYRALEVCTRDVYPEGWAALHSSLASACLDRINGERSENVSRAIGHYESALTVYTHDDYPEHWAATHSALATASIYRGDWANDIEQHIYHLEQSLAVFSQFTDSAEWADTQSRLGSAYNERIQGNRADNIERAIFHTSNAMAIYTRSADPVKWANYQIDLASLYSDRINGEYSDNFERSIEHCFEALKVRTAETDPIGWSDVQIALARAYSERAAGDRGENVELAIRHTEMALTVRTKFEFPIVWAGLQINLGNVYSDRTEGDAAENIERSIEYYQRALEIDSMNEIRDTVSEAKRGEDFYRYHDNIEVSLGRISATRRKIAIQIGLGNQYSRRSEGDEAENVERALYHYQQAEKLCNRNEDAQVWADTQFSLLIIYGKRVRGKPTENLRQAVAHSRNALEIFDRNAHPARNRDVHTALARLYFGLSDWHHAHESFLAAQSASDLLWASSYTDAGRRSEIRASSEFFSADAYSLIQLKRESDGLTKLEHGKARFLGEALALEQMDVAILPMDTKVKFVETRKSVRELEAEERRLAGGTRKTDYRQIVEALSQARFELWSQIETIRMEHPNFLPSELELDELLDLIPENGALVALLVTEFGAVAYVVPHGASTVSETHLVFVNELPQNSVQTMITSDSKNPDIEGWLNAYTKHKNEMSTASRLEWGQKIDQLGSRLWNELMGPIHQRLQSFGLAEGAPVLMMPQGGLGLLPLHAAWREHNGERRYWIEDYTTSYVPSGSALRAARVRLTDSIRQEKTILCVVNPTNDANLRHSPLEADAVLSNFEQECCTKLSGEAATFEAVKTAAPRKSYLHFSCHGHYNWQYPLESGLSLANDETMTIARVVSEMDLSACRLVTLSACETGVTDISQSPDEFLGLPAGLMQAGAPGVLSTLWLVRDDSARYVTEHFYELHLIDGLPPADALRGAQLRLLHSGRSTEVGADRFGTSVPRQDNSESLSLSHPLNWAAFTFNGA